MMQFQNPNFLWALLCLAVPILIHLFNLRRHKTIYFSDIRFLKQIEKNTKKQRTLKEWLILAARMLALAALVIAFAKPYFPSSNAQQKAAITEIFVDNSASTTAGLAERSPLERGKQLANELIKNMPEDARISLHTVSLKGHQNGLSKREALQLISQISATDGKFAPQFENINLGTHFLISDLQKNNLQFLGNWPDSAQLVLLPTIADEEKNMDNIAIDSVWAEAPFLISGQNVKLFIKLKNYSVVAKDFKIDVQTNDLPEINIAAKISAASDTILEANLTQLKSGFNTATLQIIAEDAAFDNRQIRVYHLPLSNNIVEIHERNPSPVISNLFQGEEFNFQSVTSASATPQIIGNADLIIINGLTQISSGLQAELQRASENSNLFFIPSSQNNEAQNKLAQKLGIATFGKIDTTNFSTQLANKNDAFFKDVFAGNIENAYWPTVQQHFPLSKNAALPTFPLLSSAIGKNFFVRYAHQQTQIFQLSVPLNPAYSDLLSHPLVVPMFIKALQKNGNLSQFTGQVGTDKMFFVPDENIENEDVISLVQGNVEQIPQQQQKGGMVQILAGKNITKSGIATLQKNKNTVGKLSFVQSPSESNLSRYAINEIEEIVANQNAQNIFVLKATADNVAKTVAQWQKGTPLWKYFAWGALLFVLVEVILLRFFK